MELQHYHLESVDSTNSFAKREVARWQPHKLTLITARSQTAGRGRLPGRTWLSPAGMNVCGSFCFFLPRNRRDIASLSLVMALSVVDLLELYGCKPVIKWPNDIWVAGAKIAGILTEVVPYGDLQCIVVGIGVNVNMGNEELAAVDQAATSLSLLYGRQLDPQLVTLQLAEIFRVYLERFIAEGFAPFFARYGLKLLHKKGDIIAFNRSGMAAEGVLQQINGDGSLEILTSEGLMITLRSGELL